MALCVSVRVMGILAAHHTQPQAGLLTNASSCFLSLILCESVFFMGGVLCLCVLFFSFVLKAYMQPNQRSNS